MKYQYSFLFGDGRAQFLFTGCVQSGWQRSYDSRAEVLRQIRWTDSGVPEANAGRGQNSHAVQLPELRSDCLICRAPADVICSRLVGIAPLPGMQGRTGWDEDVRVESFLNAFLHFPFLVGM